MEKENEERLEEMKTKMNEKIVEIEEKLEVFFWILEKLIYFY